MLHAGYYTNSLNMDNHNYYTSYSKKRVRIILFNYLAIKILKSLL